LPDAIGQLGTLQRASPYWSVESHFPDAIGQLENSWWSHRASPYWAGENPLPDAIGQLEREFRGGAQLHTVKVFKACSKKMPVKVLKEKYI
jgi:hypothetical protein